MYFEDRSHNYHRIEDVCEISNAICDNDLDKSFYREIKLASGRQVEVWDSRTYSIENYPIKVFPCKDGTFVIGVDNDGAFWKRPVLSWGINLDTEVIPITIFGSNDGGGELCDILFPEGHVSNNAGAYWMSLGAYQEDKAS